MNTLVLILYINPWMYCVIYDVINKFQGKFSRDSKKKNALVS
jgi:hypothetical protein